MPSGLDLSVVAPCYNEAENLPELSRRVEAAFRAESIRGELLLVNDGSQDDTGSVIDRLAEAGAAVRGAHHPRNLGITAGWRTGLSAAAGEYVCLIDADLQYQPEDVPRLFREIRASGADVVQGWRSLSGRKADLRYFYSRVLNSMLNGLFGMRLRDNKSGFVVCRRAVLDDILRHRMTYHYFQSLIAVAAHHKGYSIREIEVIFAERSAGRSFMSGFPVRVIFGVLSDMTKALIEYRMGRPR